MKDPMPPTTRMPTPTTIQPPAAGTPAYDTLAGILAARYSCRGFLDRPVPRETIDAILAAAQRTASWCNAQPWKLYMASGSAIERLRRALPEQARHGKPAPDFAWPQAYRGVYLERRRECGWGLYEALGIARGDREASAAQALENFRFFGAPHVAIVTTDAALGVYGAVDCGAYVSNFMLAATSLGVATIAQAALASHPGPLREQLGIGEDRLILCGISFGFADPAHPANAFRTTRADPADCVEWRE
jgi:nitroreductase